MDSKLLTLIHPMDKKDFIHHYKNNIPFVSHQNKNDLIELTSLPFLKSLESLLNSWPLPIDAHLPDLRDEASSITTNAVEALKLFQNGMGLLFNEVQLISPLLHDWLNLLRLDLELSSLTYGRCLIYATPDGKGTAAHFDQNINFVCQIHGTKIWKIAKNSDVINPLTRHTMGTMPDSEMLGYLDRDLPKTMPEDFVEYELKPGSVLFLPRGCWHSTEAQGDALALNFTFTAPTWIDIFSAALRSRLALSPDWRDTADGVSGDSDRQYAIEKFDYLLNDLVNDMPNWRAADILDVTES